MPPTHSENPLAHAMDSGATFRASKRSRLGAPKHRAFDSGHHGHQIDILPDSRMGATPPDPAIHSGAPFPASVHTSGSTSRESDSRSLNHDSRIATPPASRMGPVPRVPKVSGWVIGYGVIMGAMFSAFFPQGNIRCEDWWIPFFLSLVCSLATNAAVFRKLYRHQAKKGHLLKCIDMVICLSLFAASMIILVAWLGKRCHSVNP